MGKQDSQAERATRRRSRCSRSTGQSTRPKQPAATILRSRSSKPRAPTSTPTCTALNKGDTAKGMRGYDAEPTVKTELDALEQGLGRAADQRDQDPRQQGARARRRDQREGLHRQALRAELAHERSRQHPHREERERIAGLHLLAPDAARRPHGRSRHQDSRRRHRCAGIGRRLRARRAPLRHRRLGSPQRRARAQHQGARQRQRQADPRRHLAAVDRSRRSDQEDPGSIDEPAGSQGRGRPDLHRQPERAAARRQRRAAHRRIADQAPVPESVVGRDRRRRRDSCCCCSSAST